MPAIHGSATASWLTHSTSAAALAALIAPDLLLNGNELQPFNPKLLAGIVVSLIALRTRRPWLPFLLGMGLLVGLQKGLGW